MKRRKVIKLTAYIFGATLIGTEFLFVGCNTCKKGNDKNLFSESYIELLDEISETILPKTELSPGAKEAKIGLFIKSIVTEQYDENKRNLFIDGIDKINKLSEDQYSLSFINLEKDRKYNILKELDREALKIVNTKKPHFFTSIKQLIIWAYFSSESGATKALRYVSIPGEFKGCIPYKKGDKAWAI